MAVCVGSPSPAQAGGWEVDGVLRNRVEESSLTILRSRPRVARQPELVDFLQLLPSLGAPESTRLSYLELSVWGGVEGHLAGPLYGRIGFDTGLVAFTVDRALDEGDRVPVGFEPRRQDLLGDGIELSTHLAETWLLGESYLDLQPDPRGVVRIRCGKLWTDVGWGAVFTAYAFGCDADVRFDLAKEPLGLGVRLFAGLPSGRFNLDLKNSPLFALELSSQLQGPFSATFLAALLVDGDDVLAPGLDFAYNRSLVECPQCFGIDARTFVTQLPVFQVQRTQGAVGWLGGRVAYEAASFLLEAVGVLGVGESQVGLRLQALGAETEREASVGLWGGFLQLQGRWELDPVWLSSFALFATGDSDAGQEDGRYSAFFSLAPALPFTSIFLNGATVQFQQSPSLQTVAPFGGGLGGGGITVGVAARDLQLELSGAAFGAPHPAPQLPAFFSEGAAPPPRPGNHIGTELGARATWFFAPAGAFSLDASWFIPGSFFPGLPVSWLVSGGLRFAADGPKG